MNRREFLVATGSALAAAGCQTVPTVVAPARVVRTPYRGWTDALTLQNGVAEVVVVPSVGRVMQFGFTGRPGVFWENPELLGKAMPADPWQAAVGSFGGDKTWPAPQSVWNWPPPDIFDRSALTGTVEGTGTVLLTSPVSPRFGIRTERRITLDPRAPVLRIQTTYHKVTGDPVDCAVWIITQLRDPERAFLAVPAGSRFPTGWSNQWKMPAEQVTVRDGLVSVVRQPKGGFKVGNDGSSLLWVGAEDVLRIDLERESGALYPDEGCSAEIYTNGDPVPYVELETLGPLRRLAVGQSATATNTYRLFRRSGGDVWAEARRWMTAT
jgi:hypothetical protein